MKFISLLAAAYVGLVLETTIMPELIGTVRCSVLLWPVLPFVALLLPRPIGLVFATLYGLAIDAVGGGRLGVCSILCVVAVLMLQRFCTEAVLHKVGRTIGITLVTAIALSMALFVVESLLNWSHWNQQPTVVPRSIITQLLLTSFAGAVVAGLVSTPLRIVGINREHDWASFNESKV